MPFGTNVGASGKLRVRVYRVHPTLWQKIKGESRPLDKPPRLRWLLDCLNPFSGPARARMGRSDLNIESIPGDDERIS